MPLSEPVFVEDAALGRALASGVAWCIEFRGPVGG